MLSEVLSNKYNFDKTLIFYDLKLNKSSLCRKLFSLNMHVMERNLQLVLALKRIFKEVLVANVLSIDPFSEV